MIRIFIIVIFLLNTTTIVQARWLRYTIWHWQSDPRILHRLTTSQINERLCRIEWARNHPVGDGRIMILSYEGQLRCAKRYHGAMYE